MTTSCAIGETEELVIAAVLCYFKSSGIHRTLANNQRMPETFKAVQALSQNSSQLI
jgi:hypothetical protein